MKPATARITADHAIRAVVIEYADNDGDEAWAVTLGPLSAIELALKIARVAGELDAEGDET